VPDAPHPSDRSRSTPLAVGGGAVAGLTAGLFGVGGGVLLVPLLTLVLQRSQHVAHATSLVAVTLAAIAGTVRFGMDGAVSVPGALALAAGAVVGARAGARFLPKVSEGGLRRLFAVVLLVLSLRFLLGVGGDVASVAGPEAVPTMTGGLLALHVLGGLAAGVTSAVLGVGGGVLMVPLMVLGLGYGQHVAEGTSLAVIIPTAISGATAHARNGYTDWSLGMRIGAGSLLASFAGASIALTLPAITLGRLYGGLQLVVALLMLRRPGAGPTDDPAPEDALA
jgi:uncharacterized protein